MSDEIKVFKCDDCNTPELCLSGSIGCYDEPISCKHNLKNRKAPWRPTTDYQIIEKGKIVIDPESMKLDKMYLCERLDTTGGPLMVILNIEDEIKSGATFKDFVITKKQAPTTFQASDINQHQTPNCAICEWKHEEKETNGLLTSFVCTSQGLNNCDSFENEKGVYNSTECQKLFQPKEDQTGERKPEKPKSTADYVRIFRLPFSIATSKDRDKTLELIGHAFRDGGVRVEEKYKSLVESLKSYHREMEKFGGSAFNKVLEQLEKLNKSD